jgi:hypothetical protein
VEAAMDAADHRRQIEQQINRAWQTYVTACLDHQTDSAALAMDQIDRLLDLPVIPRQRQPDDESVIA